MWHARRAMTSGGRVASRGQGGAARFAALRLAVRGIRWRRWASLATFVVAILASGAAVLGPLYARAADDSLVTQRLLDAPPIATGVSVRASNAGQIQYTPEVLLTAVVSTVEDPSLDPEYGPSQSAVVRSQIRVTTEQGMQLGIAPVAWRQGLCTAAPIVEGACPAAAQEVMISQRLATDSKLAVGDTIVAQISPEAAQNQLRIVGIYDQSRPDPIVYAVDTPATAMPPGGLGEGPATLDELLVARETAMLPTGEVGTVAFRPLLVDQVTPGQLPGIVTDIQALQAKQNVPATVTTSGLPALVDALGPARSLLRSSTLAVSAQVAALVWFVLFLVVASATDERANEVAVAKLRGRRTRSTLLFAVAEPLILTTLAVPIGFLLAWFATLWLAARWFVADTPVTVGLGVVLVALIAVLGGLFACLLAGRKVLTVSVNDELRRTSSRRIAGGLVLDAVVVTLALVSISQIRGGEASGLALLAPGLVSLAIALVAVRVLPLLVALGVRRTRGSRRVASFLALRNVARRPGSSRLVVLLTVAVGLAVFAVDGAAVASEQRLARARVEVGAPQVALLTGGSAAGTLEAVRKVDPDGTWAMAAVQVPSPSGTNLMAVDATRLAAVSAWTPSPGAGTLDDVAATLHPPAAPTVAVTGRLDLNVTLTSVQGDQEATQEEYQDPNDGSIFPTALSVTTRRPDGRVVVLPIGRVHIGTQDLHVDLVGCDKGCLLGGFVIESLGNFTDAKITLVASDLTDSQGPLALPDDKDAWRSGLGEAALVDPDMAAPATVEGTPGGFTVRMNGANKPFDVVAEYADHPAVLPALPGPDTELNTYVGTLTGSYASGLSGASALVHLSEPPSVLPRLGTDGLLVDLPYALASDPAGTTQGSLQVWLGTAAPADALQQLADAGLAVGKVETVAEREQELAQDGASLAFPYFVLAAVLAVVLAGGALLVSAAVGARRRSYELAALRVLGARSRMLVAASRRELVLLIGFGVVVGTAAGLGAAWLVLPYLPATKPVPIIGNTVGGPAWLPVLAVVVGVLVVTLALAQVAAVRIARMSVPERLRESQA